MMLWMISYSFTMMISIHSFRLSLHMVEKRNGILQKKIKGLFRKVLGSERSIQTPILHKYPNLDEVGSKVDFRNSVKKFELNNQLLKKQVSAIISVLQLSDFEVHVSICSEKRIQKLNNDWRGFNKSTDILSFPANEFTSPGVFAEDPSHDFEKILGDIFIAPAYVQRVMAEDYEEYKDEMKRKKQEPSISTIRTGVLSSSLEMSKELNTQQIDHKNEADDDDENNDMQQQDLVEGGEDAGVSLAMSRVFNLQGRIHLLLIHGILHLLEYDHEEESDWKLMTDREEFVMREIKEHFKDLHAVMFQSSPDKTLI